MTSAMKIAANPLKPGWKKGTMPRLNMLKGQLAALEATRTQLVKTLEQANAERDAIYQNEDLADQQTYTRAIIACGKAQGISQSISAVSDAIYSLECALYAMR